MAAESAAESASALAKFEEKFVNFLGVPPSKAILENDVTSNGWLVIHNQKDLAKALECELDYVADIHDSLEFIPECPGILGRVSRADPTVLELCGIDMTGTGQYEREIADHDSCFEHGVGIPGPSGERYIRARDGKFAPHDEIPPDVYCCYVVYRLRRRSPAVKSA